MSVPILVVVPWASGGRYDSYRLSTQGLFFLEGIIPRFVFMANLDPHAGIDNELAFILVCQNLGTVFGAICVSLLRLFTHLPLGQEFSCDLILHRGVYLCQKKKNCFTCTISGGEYFPLLKHCMLYEIKLPNVVHHRWVTPSLCVTSVKKLHLRCLDQMSGHTSLTEEFLSFAFRGGSKYHQNSLKSDVWYTTELFKDQEQKRPGMKVIMKSYVNSITHSNKKE